MKFSHPGILKLIDALLFVFAVAAALVLSLSAGCGGGSGGSSSSAPIVPTQDQHVVLAANDLGMHCMDLEFSVFSILPPFNVVHAQVVLRPANGVPSLMDATEVSVRYDAVQDPGGSINSFSLGKTDFWDHAPALFGMNLALGQGLAGA